MSGMTTNARRPLTLAKPVKNTLEDSTLVKAKRSPQRHVLPAGSERALCGVNPSGWAATDEEFTETTVNWPFCADALKAKKAKQATA